MVRVKRLTYPIFGLVLLVLALFWLGRTLDVIPATLNDLALRAWPALLVLFGLVTLLHGRLPFGRMVAVVLTVFLVIGVGYGAYTDRADQIASGEARTFDQMIPADVTLLRVRVQTLTTDIELLTGLTDERVVMGEFVGSPENEIMVDFDQEADGTATLTLREERVTTIPDLDTIGRGVLQVELPQSLPIDVGLIGDDGTVSLNLSQAALEFLNVDLGTGSALITLPSYKPTLSDNDDVLGTLEVANGDMTLFIPPSVAGRLALDRGSSNLEPSYNEDLYNYLRDDILESRLINTAPIVHHYTVIIPRGRFRLEVPGEVAG